MKKIFLLFLFSMGLFLGTGLENTTFAVPAPEINCVGLPGCSDTDITNPTKANVKSDFATTIVGKTFVDVVVTFIKYIGVMAVISLMLGGIMYILSGGEEEKVKKAKGWIIWSLVGVFMSVSAWGIISFITQITIT